MLGASFLKSNNLTVLYNGVFYNEHYNNICTMKHLKITIKEYINDYHTSSLPLVKSNDGKQRVAISFRISNLQYSK